MSTVYDWLTMAVFAGLLVTFLQRSIGPRPANDRVINYLPPAVGCGLANYAGNESYALLSAVILVAVLGYIWVVIRPFRGIGGV